MAESLRRNVILVMHVETRPSGAVPGHLWGPLAPYKSLWRQIAEMLKWFVMRSWWWRCQGISITSRFLRADAWLYLGALVFGGTLSFSSSSYQTTASLSLYFSFVFVPALSIKHTNVTSVCSQMNTSRFTSQILILLRLTSQTGAPSWLGGAHAFAESPYKNKQLDY